MALVFCNLFGLLAGGMSVVADADTVDIYGMQVNALTEPIGISDGSPVFSWKLSSETVGQKQTGYRLVVATDAALDNTVWDSGKVESADTTDIPYSGTALADCTRYYWAVTVWDMQGRSFTSDVQLFETAFINSSFTDNAQWITLREPWDEEADDNGLTTNYAIEMDVYELETAIGVMFGSAKNTNQKAFMWQVKKLDNCFRIAPQYYDTTYKYTWRGAENTDFATDKATYDNLVANGFRLRIWVTDTTVRTYINGELISDIAVSDISALPKLGILGVRGATKETAEIDNVRVVDYFYSSAGIDLVSYDFTDTVPAFSNSNSHIENGRFIMKDPNGGTWFGEEYFATGITSKKPVSANYTIEADVSDITSAMALVFGAKANTDGSAFMWQVRDKGTYFQLAPQFYDSSKSWLWTEVNNNNARVNFGTDNYAALKADGFKMKLHVTTNEVKTYINGTLISTVTAGELGYNPGLGIVGVRYGGSEGGTVANVKVVNYFGEETGQTIFEKTEPHTATATTTLFSSTLASALSTVPNVHYTFEADVSLQNLAATLCFAMKDTSNFAMWQFVNSNGQLMFRPQVCSGGSFSQLDSINISDKLSVEQLSAGVRLKIEVKRDTVDLFADGTLINSFNSAAIPMDLSVLKFGTRIATNEFFTLDNIKAVDYIADSSGKVLFDYDCENYNPLYRGQLKDGKIQMLSSTDYGVTTVHSGSPTFRKEFKTASGKTVASARLYITSYGVFNAYLNGERIGSDELTPGWTDQDYRTCYYTYDITNMLQGGTNALAVGLNDGWTGVGLYNVSEPSQPHKLLAQARITYTDGTTEILGTDNTWKSLRTGPIVSASIFQGEYYDATADTSYRRTGYDDTAWMPAKEVKFDTTLTSRIGGQIYVREDLERTVQSVTVYDGVTDAVDGTQYGKINTVATYGDEEFTLSAGQTAVLDFGQNAAGWECLTLSGTAGTEVIVRHAEMLNDNNGLISRGNDGPEGSVYTANLRNAPSRTLYVMRSGEQTYHPSATYFGFRYLEITATDTVTVKKVRGAVLSSITEETGTFESSDSLLNRLYTNIMWGQRSNYFGQATDCPQRDERLGYSGDAQVFSQTAMYNANVKAFMYNFMDTLVEGQAPDGAYGNTMPNKESSGSVWAGVAGFADAGIIVPHTYYKQYGDKAFLERYYDSMAKYMDYLADCGAERIGQKFGDWLSYEDSTINYISYVYTIWDAQMMQEIAAVLGKTADVAKWEAMEATHMQYFRDKFLDDNGDLVSSVRTQTGYLFALKLGLYATDEAWQRGKETLVAKIKANGNKLSTGFMGTSIIMETLVELGEADLAYELLFQENNPSWLFSVKQGATTVWERWNSYSLASGFGPVSMNSFNHYAYGSVGDYFYTTILGIQAESAGYETILLAPEITDKLTYAKGSYDSANGLIKSEWKLGTNDRYSFTFTVPMNTTATVRLKKQEYSTAYSINGVDASTATLAADGAVFRKEENGYLYYAVTSGTFTFACEAIPTLTAATETSSAVETFSFSARGLSEYNNGYTANNGAGYYLFPTTDTAVVNAITSKFNLYYDREGKYLARTNPARTELDPEDVYGGASTDSTGWCLLYNEYLQRATNKKYGEIMRKIDSLVPLNSRGKEISVTNFETSFNVRFEDEDHGAVLLGFRQQTPGKFTTKYFGLEDQQCFIAIGRGGITIAGGENIVSGNGVAGDMYNAWQTETFSSSLPKEVTVKVRAIGTSCEVWIYEKNTTTQLKHYTATVPWVKAGTLAYGVSTVGHDIGEIRLSKLDEDGNVCDLLDTTATDICHLPYRRGDITVAAAEKTENGYRYTLTVAPDAQYELQAGSLFVKTADGKTYVPTRVGFRKGGTATQYTVETSGGGSVHASFVQPSETAPNIGNVGISLNAEKSGIRFISRFTHTVEDDKSFLVLDGKKYEITDYGMLIALSSVLGSRELTAETAAADSLIKQLSIKSNNVYYDYCSDHVDMSICVINLDSVAGGRDMDITARAYVRIKDGDTEKVLYGTAFSDSYNAVNS